MSANFAIDLATALWLGFTGACIGSFLNVVAYRMPRGMSVIWKPSHCPHCGHPIRARDNVPVLGWFMLRGKCRDCGGPISPRYAIVEAVLGSAFFVLAYVELFSGGANLPGGPLTDLHGAADIVWNPQWSVIGVYAYHCLLLGLLMCVLLIYQDNQTLPRSLASFSLIIGLIAPAAGKAFMAILPEKLLGCLVGFLAGVICEVALSQQSNKLLPPRWSGMQWMLLLTGLYLGWQAAVIVSLGTLLLATFARTLFSQFAITHETSKTIGVFCSVFLLLVIGQWDSIQKLITL